MAARLLVSGVVAALARHGDPKKDRNLKAVAQTISGGDILEFCREGVSKTKDPYIVQKLGRFAKDEAKTSKEVADGISTAITQIGFISWTLAVDFVEPNYRHVKQLGVQGGQKPLYG